MRILIALCLLTWVRAKVMTSSPHVSASECLDKLLQPVIDHLFGRVFESSSLSDVDLDNTVLGWSGSIAPRVRPSTSAIGISMPVVRGPPCSPTSQAQQADKSEVGCPPLVFDGPTLASDSEIATLFSLPNLGIDVAVAPSTVASGLGVFVRVSDDISEESVTIPYMTVLAGYSRNGSFDMSDSGDKTVMFIVPSLQTPVIYDEQLVPLVRALNVAAGTHRVEPTILAHTMEPVMSDEGAFTGDVKISPAFTMFFLPAEVHDVKDTLTIESVGQYCNDLAWSSSKPPSSPDEYAQRSAATNIIELVWRIEYDPDLKGLKPAWPVVVFNKDVKFTNKKDFMEIGLQYGWSYWHAKLHQ